MLNIEKVINLKKELDGLRPLKKEDELKIMQKFRLDWNFHSNHLEGNSLTYGETKALILFGITAQGKPLKDHFEVTGHDEAVNWVLDIVKEERHLTENFIRELHTLLLKETYEVDAITPDGNPTKKRVNVGVYKSQPNHVKTKTGEIFRFATPEETPAKMNDLLIWYEEKSQSKDMNSVLLAAEFHYRFIRIHPFDDGNGRVARILMNFILMKFGYPPVIIKTEDKQNYFSALQQADSGLLEPFVEYIAINLINSLNIMIKGAKGENIEEPDDLFKEISLLEQRLNAFGNPIKITKNQKTIMGIYEDSFNRLVDVFLVKSKYFERFYKISVPEIGFNSNYRDLASLSNSNIYEMFINNNLNSLSVKYSYKIFNQHGYENFDFYSTITFYFDYAKYTVYNSSKEIMIIKTYEEKLELSEINKLVNIEIKKHKITIENKIEDLINKNK